MEAQCLCPAHSPFLRSKRLHSHYHLPNGPHNLSTRRPFKPFVSASLSRWTAEISAKPSTSSYPPGFLGAVPDRSVTDGNGNGNIVDAMEYLTNILSSKVYDVAIESPLELATKLSERLGVNLWMKREDLQPVFSFKLRGAYNMMAKLPRKQLDRGGVALAAKKLKCSAVIAMPVTTPEIKWKSVERLGAMVVLIGDSYDEAQAYAKKWAKEEGRSFVPPFDHPDVIMGQAQLGWKLCAKQRVHCTQFLCLLGVKIIGVEPSDANAMALSLHRGQRIMLDQVGGFADGVAVKEVSEETFRLCKDTVDSVVLVSRDAICGSIKDMFEETRSILEPAGALSLAGAGAYCKYYGLKGENVVAITSGANMNFYKLRVVTELANVGQQQEAVLATVVPEEPGSFKHYCELVGPMNISEFKYRYNSDKEAIVLYSVGVHTASELQEMQERLESSQLKTYNLTKSDLVKDHLRYLMGGRSNVQNEILCRFVFPERPGALMKFLDVFSPRWNISLFHYRGQGETGANVLVGIQVTESEFDEFHALANTLGYDYEVVTNDIDFKLLMH
ncbi:threonine dehydratase biosynthetic [Pyrus ussuriensis x Pyrus communis]|uniref:threonine ammonia-lyase n=1 Tax=Pyrus ussuriensis x Pyrus communis TaxID=2448454 RepID=A0A5N5G4C3_9ROSA|nr:threonine dehydratase biosynthetic [Pyrus ussuriensis x Pyrus communis]